MTASRRLITSLAGRMQMRKFGFAVCLARAAILIWTDGGSAGIFRRNRGANSCPCPCPIAPAPVVSETTPPPMIAADGETLQSPKGRAYKLFRTAERGEHEDPPGRLTSTGR